MKKLTLLLVALLIVGLFAGCKTEMPEGSQTLPVEGSIPQAQPNKELELWREKNFGVPGYEVYLPLDSGWQQADETKYDLEMTKDEVTLRVIVFTSMDFEEMPDAEELFTRCETMYFKDLGEVSVVEGKAEYQMEQTRFASTLVSTTDGSTVTQHYCFEVEFDDELNSTVWVCFAAEESVMAEKKVELKAIADGVGADGEADPQEEPEDGTEQPVSDETE